MNNRIVHFEIQVDDIERAKKFYAEVFGWTYQDWSGVTGTPYWGILTAPMEADGTPSKEPGINGALLKRPCPAPKPEQGSNAYVCTVQVENFDEVAKKILEAGGTVAMPKFAIGGMAWQGYFLDTEGNTFGLHQADPNAK
jgi:predicted enzyme related to lactoylglutathione lyase